MEVQEAQERRPRAQLFIEKFELLSVRVRQRSPSCVHGAGWRAVWVEPMRCEPAVHTRRLIHRLLRRIRSARRQGTAWDRLCAIARDDRSIELVAVGTHGRTGIARALIGSVAERVVRHAPCSR